MLMLKRLVIASLAVLLLALATTACHTVHGAGEDIQSAGDTIQDKTQ